MPLVRWLQVDVPAEPAEQPFVNARSVVARRRPVDPVPPNRAVVCGVSTPMTRPASKCKFSNINTREMVETNIEHFPQGTGARVGHEFGLHRQRLHAAHLGQVHPCLGVQRSSLGPSTPPLTIFYGNSLFRSPNLTSVPRIPVKCFSVLLQIVNDNILIILYLPFYFLYRIYLKVHAKVLERTKVCNKNNCDIKINNNNSNKNENKNKS